MTTTTYITWLYANKEPSSDNNNLSFTYHTTISIRSCAPPESATANPITTHLPPQPHRLLLPRHFLSQGQVCLLPSSPSWKLVSELVSNISVEGAIQWRPEYNKPWTPLDSVQDLVFHILEVSINIVADLERDTSKKLHPVALMIKKEVIVSGEELERMVQTRIKQEREERIFDNIVSMVRRYGGVRNLDKALSEHVQDWPEGPEVRLLRPLSLIFSENMEVARKAFVVLLIEYWESANNCSEVVFLGELTESDHLLNKLRRWGLQRRIQQVKTDGINLDGDLCAVCLEKYEEESEVRRMECLHRFHKDCILKWLAIQWTCPICRYELQLVGR